MDKTSSDREGKVIVDFVPSSAQTAMVHDTALDIVGAPGLYGANRNGDHEVKECLMNVCE